MARLLMVLALSLLVDLSAYGAAGDPPGFIAGAWERAASSTTLGGDGSGVDRTFHRGSVDIRKSDGRRVPEGERAADH